MMPSLREPSGLSAWLTRVRTGTGGAGYGVARPCSLRVRGHNRLPETAGCHIEREPGLGYAVCCRGDICKRLSQVVVTKISLRLVAFPRPETALGRVTLDRGKRRER